jgi:hypothetical protein
MHAARQLGPANLIFQALPDALTMAAPEQDPRPKEHGRAHPYQQ